MIDLDRLIAELNELLPKRGWPLRRPMKSLMPTHEGGGRCCAETWDSPGSRYDGIGLQLYERSKSPVLIVFETDFCAGTAEPHEYTAEAVVGALDQFRWVIA